MSFSRRGLLGLMSGALGMGASGAKVSVDTLGKLAGLSAALPAAIDEGDADAGPVGMVKCTSPSGVDEVWMITRNIRRSIARKKQQCEYHMPSNIATKKSWSQTFKEGCWENDRLELEQLENMIDTLCEKASVHPSVMRKLRKLLKS